MYGQISLSLSLFFKSGYRVASSIDEEPSPTGKTASINKTNQHHVVLEVNGIKFWCEKSLVKLFVLELDEHQ